MKILLLKGQSQYDALRIFLDDAQSAFEAEGHDVVMLDVTEIAIATSLPAAITQSGPFDFAFSYNILGDLSTPDGTISDLIGGGPHVVQYVDHPFTHMARLTKSPRSAIVLTIDQSHADHVTSVFGQDRFAYVGFNPHAAIGKAAPLQANANAYAEARPISMLFTGTYYRLTKPLWDGLNASLKQIFSDAADLALSRDWMPAHDALLEILAAKGIGADHQEARKLLPYSFMVHEWVRRTRRFQFLKTAAKAKLPLTAFGNGYEKDLYHFKNMDYRGPASFKEIIQHMQKSRIVLNVNANFGTGSHERPLCAMMAGAVCASEWSSFYDQNFNIGDTSGEMTCFRWSTLRDDLERIAHLSENPQALFDMARAGQAKAKENHTWTSRVRTVIAAVDKARASSLQHA